MRKLLITLLIIILIVGLGLILSSGMQIGNFEIASIKKIIAENENLNKQIENLDSTIKNDYAVAGVSLSNSVKSLQASKEKYQNMISYSSDAEIKAANQTEKYEMGYLWTKIGLYATKNNVVMQVDVSNSAVSGLYNMSFIATGEYISISEFIYAIENDSSLGFKIEEFDMKPYSEDDLRATFVIRNVAIDEQSLMSSGAIVNTQVVENEE